MSDLPSILKRLDEVRTADFSRVVTGSPLGMVLTEPLIRAAWAGQIVTKSDWIAIQALVSMHYRIDPGGADDASNLFVYTCKGGWIDIGHVIASAFVYKIFLQSLRGNPIFNVAIPFLLEPNDRDLYYKILAQISVGYYQKTRQGDRLGIEFWAGFFAIRAGIHLEEIQTRAKIKIPKAKWDGNPTSAYTLEDLPSNFYGIQVGSHLSRKFFVKGVVSQFKQEITKLLTQFDVVDLNNTNRESGCAERASDVLKKDMEYYAKQAGSTYVPINREKLLDSRSVYNFTIRHRKTLSHHCVCDASNRAIDTRR